ncbi:MAG: HlyD family secretion protein, partial [Aestuariivirga sp.]
AQAQLGVLDASEQQATSVLAELQVAVDKAKHDLSFAEIRAPFDGVIANRAVAPGQFVQPGSNLMALVPVQKSFITANFKETQLVDIHPGQKVEVNVDAFKRETFEGVVDSISPASGAEFSLLPPDNATGNFTKITQRFPVKILLPPEVSVKLRPGQSVSVSVDTRDKGSN